jgi:hypothetical protein
MKKRVIDVLEKAEAIAWDTCHKIYIIMDDLELEKMFDYGYGDDMIKAQDSTVEELFATLRDWYDNACGLRFIEAVKTNHGNPNAGGFTTLVAQGDDWE